jgi:DNA-binding transcriptional LysR family regulator
MELRHLRYFVAVAQACSFTRAAAELRVAQPALSRQVQDLEDEIGVDLLVRSPRGVTLTAEGKLFLDESRDLLRRTDEAVARTQALARGEYGVLHVGYAPSPTLELLPLALTQFQNAVPGVHVVLHDLAANELSRGLLDGTLELTVMVEPAEYADGIFEFEELRRYPFCVAAAPGHSFKRLKAVPLEKLASEPIVAFNHHDYSEHFRILDEIFSPKKLRPRIAVEVDGASSLIAEIESGRGVAIVSKPFQRVAGKRLIYRRIINCPAVHKVGIARKAKGDLTPAGEKFCQSLRKVAAGLSY